VGALTEMRSRVDFPPPGADTAAALMLIPAARRKALSPQPRRRAPIPAARRGDGTAL
jgi:hypothetical protein